MSELERAQLAVLWADLQYREVTQSDYCGIVEQQLVRTDLPIAKKKLRELQAKER